MGLHRPYLDTKDIHTRSDVNVTPRAIIYKLATTFTHTSRITQLEKY